MKGLFFSSLLVVCTLFLWFVWGKWGMQNGFFFHVMLDVVYALQIGVGFPLSLCLCFFSEEVRSGIGFC